jgi:type I restriction enzyme S subunit
MSYKVVRLGDVADIVTGNTPSKSNDEFWTNGIIPFVTPGELKYNSTNYVESASDNVTELALSTARAIPKNSVMVCCIGSLGKLGIASRDLITNQQINSVVFKEEVAHYKFGYYAISLLRNEMEKIAPSTTVKIINKTLFSNLQISLPPLDIQKKIADTLDKAQELIDKRKEQISALDKFLENLFLDMFGDPVNNPMGWEVKRLKSISTKILSGNTPKGGNQVYVDKGITFFRSQNVWRNKLILEDIAFIDEKTHKSMNCICQPKSTPSFN